MLAFLQGDYVIHQHCDIELPSLTAGDYLLISKAEWTRLNPLKKLVITLYAPEKIDLHRVSLSKFPTIWNQMDQWLNERLA